MDQQSSQQERLNLFRDLQKCLQNIQLPHQATQLKTLMLLEDLMSEIMDQGE